MDGLYQQKHLEKSPVTIEKKKNVNSLQAAKNAEKIKVNQTRQSVKINAGIIPETVPLSEKDKEALIKAASSAADINLASREKAYRRINSYGALKKKYGAGVTMETAVLQNELRKYYSGVDVSSGQPDISVSIFDRKLMNDSAAHYDIKNVMKVKKALTDIKNDPAAMASLSLKERTMLKAGLDSLPEFENAVSKLLKANGLDENGNIDGKPIADGTYTSSREAAVMYRKSFSASLKKSLGSDELKLSERTQKEIDKLAAAKGGSETGISRHAKKIASLTDGDNAPEMYKGALEKLQKEYRDTAASINEKKTLIGAMKAAGAKLTGAEKDKVEARIACMEQDMDFYILSSKNKRTERMIKGICLGRPLTKSMKSELSDKYGV